MAQDKDDRKRPHLRLVVNNVEQRKPRPATGEEDFVPLEALVARRDSSVLNSTATWTAGR